MSFEKAQFQNLFPLIGEIISQGPNSALDTELYAELMRLAAYTQQQMIDPVMGIPKREQWYGALTRCILNAHPTISEWNGLTLETLALAADTLEPTTSLHVAAADLGFLSAWNDKEGHQEGGDTLLRGSGEAHQKVARGEEIVVGRTGGDETMLFVNQATGAAEEIVRICQSIERDVAQIQFALEGHRFKGSIDFGTASFEEALRVFRRYTMMLIQRNQAFPIGSRLSTLVNTLVNIADLRCKMSKVYVRLQLLTELWINHRRVYREMIAFLRKGGGNTSDKRIRELSALRQEGEDVFLRTALVIATTRKPTRSLIATLTMDEAVTPFL